MKRLALFAHYDAQGQVKRYVTYLLRKLREDCDRIDFVSTAELSEGELAKVRPYCADARRRDNVGYDFGMWKHALERTDLDAWDEIVLTNSSVFGPTTSLGPIFERMGAADCDAWGMTDNEEIAWHLQSYFLVFKRRVIASDAFAAFWASVGDLDDKRQVISRYEVGLSRTLVEGGFSLRPLTTIANLAMPLFSRLELSWKNGLRARRVNPTLAYPLALLRAGMPFVKAELLRDNPWRVPLAPVYRELRRAGFDESLIELDRPRARTP